MIAPSSTPFKILNMSDENDSSVIKKSFKGAKTADFSSKGGLISFPSSSKPGLSLSTRKPLLELSKGQLNSRHSNNTTKPNDSKGSSSVSKPMKLAFDIPVTVKKAASVSVRPKPIQPAVDTSDMICSGSRQFEDPYDTVMRRAKDIKIMIVPDTGCENVPRVDHIAELKKFGDSCVFNMEEFEANFLDNNTCPADIDLDFDF